MTGVPGGGLTAGVTGVPGAMTAGRRGSAAPALLVLALLGQVACRSSKAGDAGPPGDALDGAQEAALGDGSDATAGRDADASEADGPDGAALDGADDAPPADVAPCFDWSERVTAVAPHARKGMGIAYDADRKRVIVFGGVDDSANPYADLWEWDGDAWADRTPAVLPPSWPPKRQFPAMTYDRARRLVIIFGGELNAVPDAGWWEWDGATGTMTQRRPAAQGAPWPPARSKHGLVYDERRARLVIFGGFASADEQRGDLWELDGAAGTAVDRTPSPLPAAWPVARIVNGGASYDAASGRMLVFGGQRGVLAYLDDLWAWDGGAGLWTELSPKPRPASWPPARACHASAWDAARGRLMVFEGCAPTFLRDLWEWSPSDGFATRTPPVVPPSWPPALEFPGLAYDEARQVLVQFGGGGTGGDAFSARTFEYHCSE